MCIRGGYAYQIIIQRHRKGFLLHNYNFGRGRRIDKGNNMKIIANFGILIKLASALGKAEQSGDIEAIEKARKEHEAYKKIVLEADELTTGHTYGSLSPRR